MPNDGGDERLAFDKAPDAYDRVRPTYPDPLFDEIFGQFTSATVRALEIGPGTGKATASLLARGAHVTAVEPGANLAAFLRNKFAGKHDGQLDVVNATFEDAVIEPGYDLVLAATSFHWVDRDVRLQKAHDVLRAGGTLAVISTNQIKSETDRGYFARSQAVYKRYFPDEDVPELPGKEVAPAEFGDIDASELFGPAQLHRYRWDQTYPTADYADLMRSYSGMQMMEPGAREALIAELCELIDREYDGSVTRPLVITLTLGFRPA